MANTKVTTGVIKDDAVGADQLASNAVVTASITDNAVTTAKISDDAILTAKISNSAITNAKMSANSVDSDQYVDASIDTAHIRDGQITSAKLDTNISVSGELTVGSHLNMGDSDILKMGASGHLQIFHDGTHANIKESGSGDLQIFGDNVNIFKADGSQNLINATSGGAVTLYYAGNAKIATTSGGVTITGTANVGSVSSGSASSASEIIATSLDNGTSFGSNRMLKLVGTSTTDNSRMGIHFTGNTGIGNGLAIIEAVNEDQSAGHTSLRIHTYSGSWNENNLVLKSGSVGIGNNNPTARLTIDNSIATTYSTTGYAATPSNSMLYLNNTHGGSNTASLINFRTGSGDGVIGFVEGGGTNDADFVIQTDGGSNGVERLRISNSGNVGIGLTNQANKLQVDGDICIGKATTSADLKSTLKMRGANGSNELQVFDLVNDGENGRVDFKYNRAGNAAQTIMSFGATVGNVGIGTTSPSEKLTVTGGICQNTGQPTASNGQFVHFNTGSRTVSSSTTSTVTLIGRSPDANVSSTGTCYLAGENSGGSIQFGVIIDFFYSNGTLQTTARETGSSQGTVSVSIAESGSDLAISVTYGGGLGGAIRYTAAGHAVNASY